MTLVGTPALGKEYTMSQDDQAITLLASETPPGHLPYDAK